MKVEQKLRGDNLKGIIFAFVVSFSIWIYSVMNSEYSIVIKVPLNIYAPEKFSISGKIPEKIDVLVSAVGWQLLNLTLFPKSAVCNINIDQTSILNEQILLTKNDFIRGITLGVNAKILDVTPGSLFLDIGRMVEKVVPVEPNLIIKPRENFIVVGEPIVKPEFITIKGRSEVIEKIDRWKTARVYIEDVNKPLQIEVPLSDTLHSQITFNVSKVMVYVDVDFAAEKTIFDIPVRVEGGTLPQGHILEPKYVRATIRSGVNKLIESDVVILDAKVDYSQIINDTIGIIKPIVEVPSGMTLISLEPPYLYHSKVIRSK